MLHYVADSTSLPYVDSKGTSAEVSILDTWGTAGLVQVHSALIIYNC